MMMSALRPHPDALRHRETFPRGFLQESAFHLTFPCEHNLKKASTYRTMQAAIADLPLNILAAWLFLSHWSRTSLQPVTSGHLICIFVLGHWGFIYTEGHPRESMILTGGETIPIHSQQWCSQTCILYRLMSNTAVGIWMALDADFCVQRWRFWLYTN